MKKTDWIQTFSKKKFYPLEPSAADICIEDIAHSLSMQCRFVGHCAHFYSVAQHSWLMSTEIFKHDPLLAKYALLHDASEAYLSDLPRPLKHLPQFEFYREAERRLQAMIYRKFGLDPDEPPAVKIADRRMCAEEAMSPALMTPVHPDWQDRCEPGIQIRPTNPVAAELLFLSRFTELFGARYDAKI